MQLSQVAGTGKAEAVQTQANYQCGIRAETRASVRNWN